MKSSGQVSLKYKTACIVCGGSLSSSMWSHQSADVFLTVPLNAVHLILVLLVGCAEICCFGFICLLSVYKCLFSLFPSYLLLLDLKDPAYTQKYSIYTYRIKTSKDSDTHS